MGPILFSYYESGFPTGWDSATFWDKGTEIFSLSREKGTTEQAHHGTGRAGIASQNLAIGWDGS